MSILLTGANGFIGRYLLNYFISAFGSNNIVLLTSKPIAGIKCIQYENGELNEANLKAISAYSFDCVFHLGAFTPKSGAEANLAFPNTNNIVFTQRLLNSLSTKKIIFTSTLDVYAPASGIIDENNITIPPGLYGKSKLFCEDLLIQWGKQTNTLVQILRIGHVYGIGEEVYAKFLPQLINKAINNSPLEIWGDGTDLRAYINVIDVVKAIVKAAELNKFIGPVNVCSSESFQLIEYVKMIEDITGRKVELIFKERVGSKVDFKFDVNKMNKYLIKESVDFRAGLAEEIVYLENKLS